MAALQSGQRPRPARTSRAQARQKVWPQGTKAAPLRRAMHTQHRPPTPFPPLPSSSCSAAACWSTRVHAPARAAAVVHCRSACSSSAISDTRLSSPRATPSRYRRSRCGLRGGGRSRRGSGVVFGAADDVEERAAPGGPRAVALTVVVAELEEVPEVGGRGELLRQRDAAAPARHHPRRPLHYPPPCPWRARGRSGQDESAPYATLARYAYVDSGLDTRTVP
ncbi:hypothetical protein ZWY2020_036123 [Hordeum vulgare]|nr:hypothetical protein ZWY2020_036123 [Hordeum vulgare]